MIKNTHPGMAREFARHESHRQRLEYNKKILVTKCHVKKKRYGSEYECGTKRPDRILQFNAKEKQRVVQRNTDIMM